MDFLWLFYEEAQFIFSALTDELTEAVRSKLHVLNRFDSWKTSSYK
jgi:hypothetical protein